MNIDQIMRAAPVIPVLVLEEEMDWAALAETFVAAGLPVLEVTMRTPLALEAVGEMGKVEGAIVRCRRQHQRSLQVLRASSEPASRMGVSIRERAMPVAAVSSGSVQEKRCNCSACRLSSFCLPSP